MVNTGGLGDSIAVLSVAGSPPQWYSDKAIAVRHYFVACGVFTVFGVTFPIMEQIKFHRLLFDQLEEQQLGKMGIYFRSVRDGPDDDRAHRQETGRFGQRPGPGSKSRWTWPTAGSWKAPDRSEENHRDKGIEPESFSDRSPFDPFLIDTRDLSPSLIHP